MIFKFHSHSNFAGFVHDTELLANSHQACEFDFDELEADIDDQFVRDNDLEYEARLWGGDVDW